MYEQTGLGLFIFDENRLATVQLAHLEFSRLNWMFMWLNAFGNRPACSSPGFESACIFSLFMRGGVNPPPPPTHTPHSFRNGAIFSYNGESSIAGVGVIFILLLRLQANFKTGSRQISKPASVYLKTGSRRI